MIDITLPEVFLPILEKKKRFKVMISGRGAGKSMSVADILIMKAKTEGLKILCCREFQSSLAESVHSLVRSEAERLEIQGIEVTNNEIRTDTGGQFIFLGLARNPHSVKSLHGVDICWVEEASTLSAESIQMLTPTIREEGSELWFTANPDSKTDPFSEKFINPFQDELDRCGYYEDDNYLIIKSSWIDNPFFPDVLKQEMELDKEIMPPSLWRHVWNGDFLDEIENALILEEWFNSCIDSHKKLGFEPKGARIASHDCSDTGGDSKGYVMRHGSVVLDVQEKMSGDVNEGSTWAVGLAISQNVNFYNWDGDGMGTALNEQVSRDFSEKDVRVEMFKGSQSPQSPDAIYNPAMKSIVVGQKTNKDSFRNKRVQMYCILRDKIYRTYRAVEHGEYADPDELISFSSDIDCLNKLKSELCRLPIKPNSSGYVDLFTKEIMLSRFKIKSPNLADSLMMSMAYTSINTAQPHIPRPIGAMNLRRR